MSAVTDQEILNRKAELLDKELDKFLNGINNSKNRPQPIIFFYDLVSKDTHQ